MQRYLIIGHYLKETYTTDTLTKDDLVALKNREAEYIFDTKTGTIFDAKENAWKELPKK